MASKSVFKEIVDVLNSNKIEYKLTTHEAVRTSEEAAKIRGNDLKSGAKAMVVKAGGNFFLIVLSAERKIDWKKLKNIFHVKKIRFATEEEAEKLTSCKVGGIPPFGNVMGLKTYFDESILENEKVNFNAGLKTHSVSMNSSDLVKLVNPDIVKASIL